jgi:phosphonate transport system substrate-binding protein
MTAKSSCPPRTGLPISQYYRKSSDRDRQASSLWDLRGDIHAFSDPDSNSGFLVTRAALAERALRPETFFVKTFFTYGHRDVIRAVSSGLAGSGSVDGYVCDVVAELEPDLTAGTRIGTPSVHPPAVRGD